MGKTLFSHCRYLIMRAAPGGVVEDGAVLADGAWIAAVGESADLDSRFADDLGIERIDCRDKIVMPGLVDAHNHVGEAHALLAFGWLGSPITGLPDALERVYWPADAWLTEESAYDLTLLGLLNLLKHGATTHANAMPHPDAAYQATADAGARAAIHPQMVGTVSIPAGFGEAEHLALAERALRAYHGALHGRIRVGVHPNCTFNSSEALLKRALELALEYGAQFATHIAESPDEKERSDALWADEGGLIAHLRRAGLLTPQTLLFHGTLLSEPEIDVLAEEDVALVHCPATNALFGGCAYVPYMLEKGLRVGLGTDCATHNLFAVMLSVSQHHNIMPRRLRRLEPWTPLALATLGGARALAWEAEIGSLEVGKKADVITIDLRGNSDLFPLSPEGLPDLLALNGAGTEACDVMVDGELLRREGAFTRMDEPAVIGRGQEWCDRFAFDHREALRSGNPMFKRLQEDFRRES